MPSTSRSDRPPGSSAQCSNGTIRWSRPLEQRLRLEDLIEPLRAAGGRPETRESVDGARRTRPQPKMLARSRGRGAGVCLTLWLTLDERQKLGVDLILVRRGESV